MSLTCSMFICVQNAHDTQYTTVLTHWRFNSYEKVVVQPCLPMCIYLRNSPLRFAIRRNESNALESVCVFWKDPNLISRPILRLRVCRQFLELVSPIEVGSCWPWTGIDECLYFRSYPHVVHRNTLISLCSLGCSRPALSIRFHSFPLCCHSPRHFLPFADECQTRTQSA